MGNELQLTGQRDVTAGINVIELDGQRFLNRLPTKQERQQLQARSFELASELRAIASSISDREKAAAALALMFAGFPSLRNAAAKDMVAAYIMHLQDFPLFAIERACRDVTRGAVAGLDPDWPPSSPRLAELAEKHASKVWAEKLSVDRILTVQKLLPQIDSKRSAAVGEKMRELADGLRVETDAAIRDPEVDERVAKERVEITRKQIIDAYRARGIEPVVTAKGMLVSPYLLDLLKSHS